MTGPAAGGENAGSHDIPFSDVETRRMREEARSYAAHHAQVPIDQRRREGLEAWLRRVSEEVTHAAQERLRAAASLPDAPHEP